MERDMTKKGLQNQQDRMTVKKGEVTFLSPEEVKELEERRKARNKDKGAE